MTRDRLSVAILGMVVLVGVLAGCAKRPATIAVTAPASPSSTSAPSVTAPPRVGPAPSAPAPSAPAPSAPAPSAAAPPSSAATPPGAPAPATRSAPTEFSAIDALRDIHFDFDKYDIRPTDAKILDENATWMKREPNHLILIEGHADERGTNEYNLALGERRAKAAMNYLVSQGIPARRMTVVSDGEERPGCAEKTEACWAQNRRAHFVVKPE
ncbi:MAG: peptidoglycan-associated lipoprotein Pal [Candidatus Rokuibacteriota bacterium]